jgi:tetratricopeptide (TPR) repeat protein
MSAKTVKRLAILIAVLGLVGGMGFFTQRIQVNRMAQAEVAKANLAEKDGDFAKAEKLYSEHLQVFPDDEDVQVKYADALLKVDKSPNRQMEAFDIYQDILTRDLGRDDVRRRLMQLKFDMGNLISGAGRDDGANSDLQILLKSSPNDPELRFLMGRCYEEEGNFAGAQENYNKAILRRRGSLRLVRRRSTWSRPWRPRTSRGTTRRGESSRTA